MAAPSNTLTEPQSGEPTAPTIRLNVGCGPLSIEGEVGVDLYPGPAVGVVADACALPWQTESVDQVRLDHVLEHLPCRKVPTALLEAWRVLKPGGKLLVGIPDLVATCRAYLEATELTDKAEIMRWLYGSQAHEGEHHLSGWDAQTLTDVLATCGFVEVTVEPAPERSEGICLKAEARKPWA